MFPFAGAPEQTPGNCPALPERIRAVVLDTDSVITDLAHVQGAAWTCVLDAYLQERAPGAGMRRPDPETELPWFVDGSHLTSAVTSFLEARGLGFGTLGEATSVTHGLAVRQQAMLQRYLHRYGTGFRRGISDLLTDLRRRGILCAAVSTTARARGLLAARGLLPMLDTVLDGDDRARLQVPARPDPALLHQAARLLGADRQDTAVVDASPNGVEAAARGEFGRIIGLTPAGHLRHMTEMFRRGADLVVHDLGELRNTSTPPAAATAA
ncbi:HAD family hydrolase [Streptomyces sp. XH2]|uniref:HAD family hydrolase n=1 Tax=Streptomyces sp. XH2 TaxID=3412483 RepID=UPI003C7BEFA6